MFKEHRMLRFLLAVDGSWNSGRAADWLIKQLGWYRSAAEVHLINVQPSFPGDVTMFVSLEQIKKFHQEEGIKALTHARAKLDSASIPYSFHIGVGEAAHVITDYAREKGCDQIFMGTRGLGTVTGLLLGSVATKVVHLSDMPVVLVK